MGGARPHRAAPPGAAEREGGKGGVWLRLSPNQTLPLATTSPKVSSTKNKTLSLSRCCSHPSTPLCPPQPPPPRYPGSGVPREAAVGWEGIFRAEGLHANPVELKERLHLPPLPHTVGTEGPSGSRAVPVGHCCRDQKGGTTLPALGHLCTPRSRGASLQDQNHTGHPGAPASHGWVPQSWGLFSGQGSPKRRPKRRGCGS